MKFVILDGLLFSIFHHKYCAGGILIAHNSRCATAKTPVSRCQCSCGGSRHAPGDQTKSTSSSGGYSIGSITRPSGDVGSIQDYNPEVSDTGKALIKGAIVGGTLAAQPQLIPVYKVYKSCDFGKKLYDAADDPEEIKNTLSRTAASKTAKSVTKEDASAIATEVRDSFEQGGAEQFFGEAGSDIDREIYGTMLEGSVEGVLQSGVGEIAKYSVEGAM